MKLQLSKEQILGVIRHVLTFVGGTMVMYGLMDAGIATEITGSAVTIVGAIWSIIAKNK
jgi:hypothetical protein